MHIVKADKKNDVETRRAYQKKIVDYLNGSMAAGVYKFPMKYEIGFDYTSDPLVPANVIMQDEDAACLFHACYPISDQNLIPTLLSSSQIDDFFIDSKKQEELVVKVITRNICGVFH